MDAGRTKERAIQTGADAECEPVREMHAGRRLKEANAGASETGGADL